MVCLVHNHRDMTDCPTCEGLRGAAFGDGLDPGFSHPPPLSPSAKAMGCGDGFVAGYVTFKNMPDGQISIAVMFDHGACKAFVQPEVLREWIEDGIFKGTT